MKFEDSSFVAGHDDQFMFIKFPTVSILAVTPQDLEDSFAMSILPRSLVVDLDGSLNHLRDQSFFRSAIYWLVSNVEETSTAFSFLRFDSQVYSVDNLTIYEWYGTSTTAGDTGVVKNKVGVWNPVGELNMDKRVIWERRSLQGTPLKITYLPTPGLYELDNDEGPGFFPNIIWKMEEMSNFSSLWVLPEDRQYGRLKRNGSW